MNAQDDSWVEELGSYKSLRLEASGQRLTVRLISQEDIPFEDRVWTPVHWELGELFSRLRATNQCRVVVLRGINDGVFLRPMPREGYRTPEMSQAHADPRRQWIVFTGTVRFHEAIAALEKPVIACVNGDAIGFGQSIMFACDLIYAQAGAVVQDHHLEVGVVPGDGGAALIPGHLSPALAKEYLLLSKSYTADRLAELGVINGAYPAAELDGVVDEVVNTLLSRSAYAVAWTKRLANRALQPTLQAGLDASAAYEMVNFAQPATTEL